VTQRFSVGTFNVRNLVPPSNDERYHFFYSADRKNCYWDSKDPRQSFYRRKITWLARQLERMDCDVVCFQEILDIRALEDVIEASAYAGKVDLHLAGEPVYTDTVYEGKPARIYTLPRIALMLRHPFKTRNIQTLTHFPKSFDLSRTITEKTGREWKIELHESNRYLDYFNRPVMKAVIQLPERFRQATGWSHQDGLPEITLFAAHLKSKRPVYRWPGTKTATEYAKDYLQEYALGQARSLLLRGVESAALRSYVLESLTDNPEKPLLVVGDLNDGPRSITTDIAGGLSQPGIETTARGREFSHTNLQNLSADLALYSSYHLQTRRTHRDVYYTHIYDGFHDSLDHVLVSSHFVPKWMRDGYGRENIGKVGTLRVFNDHLINAELDDMKAKKIGKFFHTRSDHGQVSVRIDWFEINQKKEPRG